MAIVFQAAELLDLELLIELMREFYECEQLPFDDPGARVAVGRLLADDSLGRVWIIRQGKAAIGYVVLTVGYSLEFLGRDAFIDELYLRADYRRQGVGTQTLQFVEEVCPTLGIRALHLEVNRANTKAQAVYQKAGFRPRDHVLMTKQILL
jgi:GNAT superfamily N-acetyltransferase